MIKDHSFLIAGKTHDVPMIVEDRREPVRILIASLSLGGAEKIVLDWATSEAVRGRHVEIAVLHRVKNEWPVHEKVLVIRRRGTVDSFLSALCGRWGRYKTPVSTHLIRDDVLSFIWEHGLKTVPVIHNDKKGWRNDPKHLNNPNVASVIACADFVAGQMVEEGYTGSINTVKHMPLVSSRVRDRGIRKELRDQLGIDDNTLAIVSVGAIKEQKNYVRAVEILAETNKLKPAVLCILGDALNEDGRLIVDQIKERASALNVLDRVKLLGFVSPCEKYYPAMDVMLNCSHFEGFSIATQEALVAGLPTVATKVSGQSEINDDGLLLLSPDASNKEFADNISLHSPRKELNFKKRMNVSRLWSLTTAIEDVEPEAEVETLFLTANLNAGGAQRSLVNLASALAKDNESIEVAVCNTSTHAYFSDALDKSNVKHYQLCESRDVFDLTTSLLQHIHRKNIKTLCFWNVDPKMKLLLTRFLPKHVKMIDVSPGGYAFSELEDTKDFQQAVYVSVNDFYERLDHLVLKFDADTSSLPVDVRTSVIRNGVHINKHKVSAKAGTQIMVSGRITKSKHILSIIRAFREFLGHNQLAELHFYGQAEERDSDYLQDVLREAEGLPVKFMGSSPELKHLEKDYDMTIVMGTHQGCPNAVLEAFASNIPVIANDSGGTRELVQNEHSGLLIPDQFTVNELVDAMLKMDSSDIERNKYQQNAMKIIEERFSMENMKSKYKRLLFAKKKQRVNSIRQAPDELKEFGLRMKRLLGYTTAVELEHLRESGAIK